MPQCKTNFCDKHTFCVMAWASDSNSYSQMKRELSCLNADELLDNYINSLQHCPKGHSLRKISDDLQIKFCDICNDVFGADDSMSVHDVDAIVNTWKFACNCCGNQDIDQYTITPRGLQCKCGSITTLGQSEIKEGGRLICTCGNENQETIYCVRSKDKDEFLGYKCRCGKVWRYETFDDFPEQDETIENKNKVPADVLKKTKATGRRELFTAGDIKPLTHIMFWRSLRYYHHALVTKVYPEENAIDVIHYDGPIKDGNMIGGEVTSSHYKLNENKDRMFEAVYDGPVYDDDMCLFRATTRLGEKSYNLLTNNCEHFVRWCKTGVEYSSQVDIVIDSVKDFVKELTTVVQKGAQNIVYRGVGVIIDTLIKFVTTGPGKGAMSKLFTSNVVKYLGPAAIVTLEIAHAAKGIKKEYSKYKKNDISQREFVGVCVQKSTKALLGCAGTIAGTFVGQILIPIPVVGAYIGSSFGAMLGHLAGSMLGKWFQKKIGK